METIILFGAGASHGSQRCNTPALTERLFAELRAFAPQSWRRQPPRLQEELGGDFEVMIEYLVNHRRGEVVWELNLDMGRYFNQFRPAEDSLYTDFLKRVAGENVTLASLNYDLLLPRAAAALGHTVYPMGFFKERPPIGVLELILPHGSSGLVPESSSMGGCVADNPYALRTPNMSCRLLLSGKELEAAYQRWQQGPVMTFFDRQKNIISGEHNVRVAKQRWDNVCGGAARIAIVGVAYREHDEHIFGPLRRSSAQILVIAGPTDGKSYRQRLKFTIVSAVCEVADFRFPPHASPHVATPSLIWPKNDGVRFAP